MSPFLKPSLFDPALWKPSLPYILEKKSLVMSITLQFFIEDAENEALTRAFYHELGRLFSHYKQKFSQEESVLKELMKKVPTGEEAFVVKSHLDSCAKTLDELTQTVEKITLMMESAADTPETVKFFKEGKDVWESKQELSLKAATSSKNNDVAPMKKNTETSSSHLSSSRLTDKSPIHKTGPAIPLAESLENRARAINPHFHF
jgi:succinylglutamate desuccinylase